MPTGDQAPFDRPAGTPRWQNKHRIDACSILRNEAAITRVYGGSLLEQ
jgi:hypothetical protein